MHIVRYRREHDDTARVGVRADGVVRELPVPSVAALLRESVADLRDLVARPGDVVDDARLLAPVDGGTEVWAAGVTYLRSREARMEESSEADIYGRVYDAARPELFFKSAAWRVVVDGDPVAIRADSGLDVPEPELALVINRFGEIAGYLVCNDMSSRSIEGENPLYLPQAKVYAGACALSAGIRPAWEVDGTDLAVAVRVTREGVAVWSGRDVDRPAQAPVRGARRLPVPGRQLPGRRGPLDRHRPRTGDGLHPAPRRRRHDHHRRRRRARPTRSWSARSTSTSSVLNH